MPSRLILLSMSLGAFLSVRFANRPLDSKDASFSHPCVDGEYFETHPHGGDKCSMREYCNFRLSPCMYEYFLSPSSLAKENVGKILVTFSCFRLLAHLGMFSMQV
jgi:hypothetical protein